MSEQGSIDRQADFNLAVKILSGLVADASLRAEHDPEWVERRDKFTELRKSLDPADVDGVRAVLTQYGPLYGALTNPR
ncbi:hypothetical protein OG225_41595 (plasmid) [Nocardia sp. NBC_01377]